MASNVWSRSGQDEMNRGTFYLVLGVILSWGFVLTRLVPQSTADWHPGIGMLLLIGLGIPIVGVLMSGLSKNPLVSFIGFNLVVVGLSAILGPALAIYALKQPGLIERAAGLTALATLGMGISGLLFPNFYKQIGGVLFGALTVLVLVSFVRLFIPALQGVGIIDYISAAIFSLYIGYDMYRASNIPATLDNAVDVAVSLYLDILNLFLYFCRILLEDQDE